MAFVRIAKILKAQTVVHGELDAFCPVLDELISSSDLRRREVTLSSTYPNHALSLSFDFSKIDPSPQSFQQRERSSILCVGFTRRIK